MSKTRFTNLGEVVKNKKDPSKFQIRVSRKIIIEETVQSYTNKEGKKVERRLPKVEINPGSYLSLLDPNRGDGSIKKPDFIKYDIVHVESEE